MDLNTATKKEGKKKKKFTGHVIEIFDSLSHQKPTSIRRLWVISTWNQTH